MTSIRKIMTKVSTMAGIGNRTMFGIKSLGRHTLPTIVLVVLALLPVLTEAQEVLLPVRHAVQSPTKSADTVLVLPFFDDFSRPATSAAQWHLGGTFVNTGYAPLPPTIGMATLDAFDAGGCLYPTVSGQLFSADTMMSLPVRLDSAFVPYARALSPDDSIYFSFFYLPGGGYGNMWERVGDIPERQDSLILEFYSPSDNTWDMVWSVSGCEADSLFAHTGTYWQFCDICIDNPKYLDSRFRFRFRNYCSLDNINKNGLLSNADQWNIDYVLLNVGRHKNDTASRDVAFVNPAPSMLARYQAMPARQFRASDMADSLHLVITNRYTEELATEYGYSIFDDAGQQLYHYDGGYENAPVYWHSHGYQMSLAHAAPRLGYSFPISGAEETSFTAIHHLREGVSGDVHTSNDSVAFRQVFDDYYAYDDGTSENGYGVSSTSSKVWLACRYSLNVEDTLTAVAMYFNRTLADQNADIKFLLTVWDDADGRPGNILYQDVTRRKPQFEGFNTYVTYPLESPVICGGTIYVGLEQLSNYYINLGFDRNCDASSDILYRSAAMWQTSILRGALMLRPRFGQKPLLALSAPSDDNEYKAFAVGHAIAIESVHAGLAVVYNALGQEVSRVRVQNGSRVYTSTLPSGLYLARMDNGLAKKVIIY